MAEEAVAGELQRAEAVRRRTLLRCRDRRCGAAAEQLSPAQRFEEPHQDGGGRIGAAMRAAVMSRRVGKLPTAPFVLAIGKRGDGRAGPIRVEAGTDHAGRPDDRLLQGRLDGKNLSSVIHLLEPTEDWPPSQFPLGRL